VRCQIGIIAQNFAIILCYADSIPALVVCEQPFALMLGGTDKGSAAPGRPATATRILAANSLQMQPTSNGGSILGCIAGLRIPLPDAAESAARSTKREG